MSSSGAQINLAIKPHSFAKDFKISVSPDATVKQVRQIISETLKLQPEAFLIYGGKILEPVRNSAYGLPTSDIYFVKPHESSSKQKGKGLALFTRQKYFRALEDHKPLKSYHLIDGDHLRICKPEFLSYGSMQVFVKTLTAQTIAMDAGSDELVDNFLQKLGFICDETPDSIQLIIGGRQLREGQTMEQGGVTKESTLHMVLRLRGGMFHISSGRHGSFAPLPVLRMVLPDEYKCTATTVAKEVVSEEEIIATAATMIRANVLQQLSKEELVELLKAEDEEEEQDEE